MDPRIRLQGKDNTTILSSLDRLHWTNDPREDVRATFQPAIKILSMSPLITIKNDSWGVDEGPRSRNLCIKMRYRFPTTIRPYVRVNRNIIHHILGIVLIPERMPSGVGREGVGSKCLFKNVTSKITGRHGPRRPNRS